MSDDKDWSCDDYPDYCDEDGNPLDDYSDKDEGDDGKEDYVSYDTISAYLEAAYTDYEV